MLKYSIKGTDGFQRECPNIEATICERAECG